MSLENGGVLDKSLKSKSAYYKYCGLTGLSFTYGMIYKYKECHVIDDKGILHRVDVNSGPWELVEGPLIKLLDLNEEVVTDAAQVAIELGKKSDGKADAGKVRQSLLQVQFGKTLNSVAAVLTFGARKYPKPPLDDSWKDVPQARQRYADALYRHLHAALVLGEKKDPESGESHWAHAICNILFLANLKGK